MDCKHLSKQFPKFEILLQTTFEFSPLQNFHSSKRFKNKPCNLVYNRILQRDSDLATRLKMSLWISPPYEDFHNIKNEFHKPTYMDQTDNPEIQE